MMALTMAALPLNQTNCVLLALPLRETMSAQNCPTQVHNLTVPMRLTNSHETSIVSSYAPTLPLRRNQSLAKRGARRSDASRLSSRVTNMRGSQIKVLVVDDVSDVTEMIGLFLKHAGYEVSTADSAGAALRLAGERAFDLIISDIGMPAMNGYELAEALRNMPDYREIPIIAVTGYTEYDDRGRSLRSGFSAHMTKPINPSQLLDLMNDLLT